MTTEQNTETAEGALVGTPGRPADDEPIDLIPEDLYVKRAAERGRHEIVLGSIKAHLEEQPTLAAVHACARRWVADITAMGDEVAKTKRRSTA